ncbi:MAG: tRNA (adenosine(37)-N6)-threonylcarbamoyltransferase complex ATPase subunit type 1 TsaE [Planctomycetota bacterium]
MVWEVAITVAGQLAEIPGPDVSSTPGVDSTMRQLAFVADDENDTDRLGRVLADELPKSAVVALEGTLGAGKTRLVQAIAAACGVNEESVTSPTFVLCQPYRGTRPIYHLDAYRIHDVDEFLELGIDEYFESTGLTLIEWADRVEPALPDERLMVRIDIISRAGRRFNLWAHGTALEQCLDRIARKLDA